MPLKFENLVNYAIEGKGGTALLTRDERSKVFDRVVNDLHDENILLNYSESESNNKDFPVSVQFFPASMAARVVRMINAHPANFY